MPIRRRRPLRRVAVTGAVGAAAYNAGKNKNPSSTATPESAAHTPAAPVAPVAPVDPAAAKVEIYDALAKLGELKEKGLLSDEEFQREKLRLLDS